MRPWSSWKSTNWTRGEVSDAKQCSVLILANLFPLSGVLHNQVMPLVSIGPDASLYDAIKILIHSRNISSSCYLANIFPFHFSFPYRLKRQSSRLCYSKLLIAKNTLLYIPPFLLDFYCMTPLFCLPHSVHFTLTFLIYSVTS